MAAVPDSERIFVDEPSGGKVVGVTYGNVEGASVFLVFWFSLVTRVMEETLVNFINAILI